MHILAFDSEEAWVAALTERLCFCLQRNPTLRLCLPSGTTPLPLYAALGTAVQKKQVSFQSAEVFMLDEYGGLAADDPGRCVNMLRHSLIEQIDLPPAQFHVLEPLAPDLARVCAEYEAQIGRGFDLTLLGIGLNGHVGLNEPGSVADSPTRRMELHPQSTEAAKRYVQGSHLPTWGVTVGMARLRQSAEVWLLGRGPSKAAIIRRLVRGAQEDPSALPAALLRQHPSCWLWLDPEAGARL
jgi:6-phosphogluconolactonase/glucosamine-6-phosphate isomerase/deaminase